MVRRALTFAVSAGCLGVLFGQDTEPSTYIPSSYTEVVKGLENN